MCYNEYDDIVSNCGDEVNSISHVLSGVSELFTQEPNSIHFIWQNRGIVESISKNFDFNGSTDPFDYFVSKNFVDPVSNAVFNILKARVSDAIDKMSGVKYFESEVKMRFDDSSDYSLYNVSASVMHKDDEAVVYFRVRKCSDREAFVKSVADIFSSDHNPKVFYARIADMLKRNSNKRAAFVQFDIAHFQLINNNYGVETGDALLAFLEESLRLICGSEQMFARLNADVFMVVMPFDDEKEVRDFILSVERYLGKYNDIDYHFTFGISVCEPGEHIDIRKHQDNAVLARHAAKDNALNNVAFYDESMRAQLQNKKFIEDNMYKALDQDEFAMYLQPKYCISTGKIVGAEALARWIHPEKGLINPVDFIPVFEQNGFILKLDQVIWEKACRKIRHWLDNGIEPVPISVNVSREYLQRFDVTSQMLEYIEKYDIPRNLIELEITESYDSDASHEVVEKMKDAGFVTLMDDFGSGYSSLNMLKVTKFDVLKIDKEFLSEFMTSNRGRKIISHTIAMSNDIGLDIIAEGVETKEEADFLSGCGCDTAQGFLYSKPVPEDDFDKLF